MEVTGATAHGRVVELGHAVLDDSGHSCATSAIELVQEGGAVDKLIFTVWGHGDFCFVEKVRTLRPGPELRARRVAPLLAPPHSRCFFLSRSRSLLPARSRTPPAPMARLRAVGCAARGRGCGHGGRAHKSSSR